MECKVSLPQVVSHDEWVAARKELLGKEKEVTRARDALNAERRRLPMGRRQLIVDHFVFGPSWDDGCPSCSGRVDQYGNLAHLHARETTMAVVSRAPLAKIEPAGQ
jgi:predicted dithiol-disulfide oxidoreductase (DUF899 family)